MPVSSCTELSKNARKTLLNLVWQVIEQALEGKGLQFPAAPESDELLQPAACFVTLHYEGKLRGCIGSLEANEPLWLCACRNAYASAFEDSRFYPLTQDEWGGLSLNISILSPLTPIENKGELALKERLKSGEDGLLLEDDHHRAVFLPSVWETLTTPERFIEALKAKGGWPTGYWSDDIAIHLFTTEVVSSE
ncbi:AmmeMemoRadiSam system protein A [Vibrio sp.]|uniref:AmmeMemoRadiSam system protein A n=1 Tax=Vibrio sp. TaxID=678 RepID=UPI003D11DC19